MSAIGRAWERLKALRKTIVHGRDPRPFLVGAAPGLWSSNHLAEAHQCQGWQFVATQTLARMCSQAEVTVHRVIDRGLLQKCLRKCERQIALVKQLDEAITKAHKLEHLEAKQERLIRKAAQADSVKSDRVPAETNHPLVKLLTRPNPHWSGVTFVYALAQQLSLTGMGLVWCIRDESSNEPLELYVVPTGLAMPRMPTPKFPMGSYYITPLSAWNAPNQDLWQMGAIGNALLVGAEIDARDVKKIHRPHPIYLTDGLSPLSACSLWVDLGNEMDRSAWYKFQNSERPGMIFKRDGKIDPSPEDLAQWREDLKADAAGTPNTGKHLMPPPGVEPINWGKDTAEMEYVGSRPQIRDMNLAMHGLTAKACGISEAGGFSDFWASVKQSTELAAQPLLNLIAGELTEFLGGSWGGKHEITYSAPAIDDPQTLEQRLRTDIQAGNVMKVDEYRALRGLQPLGGDEGEAFVGAQKAAPGQAKPLVPGEMQVDRTNEDQADKPLTDGTPDEDGPKVRSPFRDAVPGRQDLAGKSLGNGILKAPQEQSRIDLQLWEEILSIIPSEKPESLPFQLGVIDGDIKVLVVDGDQVKIDSDMDFVEGGNDAEYVFIPKNELWVDDRLDLENWKFIIYHEANERRLMQNGMSYDHAHDLSNDAEKKLRQANQEASVKSVNGHENVLEMFGRPEYLAKGWDEGKHPRGQPENAGEFAPASGSSNRVQVRPIKPGREVQPTRRLRNEKDAERWSHDNYSEGFATLATDAEKDAVDRYMLTNYLEINGSLRGENKYADYAAPLIQKLDAIMFKAITPEPVAVYRGLSANLVDKLKAGDTFMDKGFVSSSLDFDVAHAHSTKEGKGGAVAEVVLPMGTAAFPVDVLFDRSNHESEMLVDRGQTFHVKSIKTRETSRGPVKFIELELVTQVKAASLNFIRKQVAGSSESKWVWEETDIEILNDINKSLAIKLDELPALIGKAVADKLPKRRKVTFSKDPDTERITGFDVTEE